MTIENGPTAVGNREIVQQALAALVDIRDVGAFAAFLSDDFVHHRPGAAASTKAQWLATVQAALAHTAGMQVEILHLLADGDHVVLHSRRRLPGGGAGIVVVDVLRLHAGSIAEAWEVIEPVGRADANLAWWAGDGWDDRP